MNSSNNQNGRTPTMRGALIVVFILIAALLFAGFFVLQSQTLLPHPGITPTASVSGSDAQKLEQIDAALHNALSGSIAYNAPGTMLLDETSTVELLLNPSLSPEELAKEVVENGQVTTSSIAITPRMKAELIPQDDGLEVKPLEENSEQVVSGEETTSWTWYVTARKGGPHKLTLVIYRLINVDGKDYWRKVETYKAEIEVQVTLVQRILSLDWKWIAGIVITLLLIPAFWRWVDGKKKKGKKK